MKSWIMGSINKSIFSRNNEKTISSRNKLMYAHGKGKLEEKTEGENCRNKIGSFLNKEKLTLVL